MMALRMRVQVWAAKELHSPSPFAPAGGGGRADWHPRSGPVRLVAGRNLALFGWKALSKSRRPHDRRHSRWHWRGWVGDASGLAEQGEEGGLYGIYVDWRHGRCLRDRVGWRKSGRYGLGECPIRRDCFVGF